MRINTYQCDVCKSTKKDSNNWFVAFTGVTDFDRRVLTIQEWSDDHAEYGKAIHLCGPACVQRKVQEFTSGEKTANG